VDKIFKSLADINRRKILTILKNSDLTVNEILKYLDIKQATLSNHLAILRKAGLVGFTVKGKLRIYKLNRESLNNFVTELNRFVLDEMIVRRINQSSG
jgi:DNA-binding transcriptional ArsR family regulator